MLKKISLWNFLILNILIFFIFLSSSAFAATKKVALLPFVFFAEPGKAYLAQGLKSMLLSRLAGEDLEVIADERVGALLDEKDKVGITSQGRAEQIARALEAGYTIFGSVTNVGTGYSLDLTVLELNKEGAKETRINETVEEAQFIPRLSEVAYDLRAIIAGVDIRPKRLSVSPRGEESGTGLFLRPSTEGRALIPTGRFSVSMDVMAFDMGDLNGDKEQELAVLSRDKLLIYGGQEGKYSVKGTFEPIMGEEFVRVSIGDADNNGLAEIYLVSLYGSRARSTVLEWTGQFKKLHQQWGHLQVVRDQAGNKSIVLFQDTALNAFFSGNIFYMNALGGGKYAQGNPLPKLKGVQFHTLAIYDLNKDGTSEFIGLGEENYLHVWDSKGDYLWSSDKKIGGSNNDVRAGEIRPGEITPSRVEINSRIAVMDVDKDGKKEVLVIKNIPVVEFSRDLRHFTKATLIVYQINGLSLTTAWSSREMDYCLVDMQTSGDTLYLAAEKPKWDNFSVGSGWILWFQ